MNLESPKIVLEKSNQYLYEILSKVENFQKLMPEETTKFQVFDKNSFVFALQGMPEITLMVIEKIEFSSIILGSINEKVPFKLEILIHSISEKSCDVQLLFNGNFNAMMAMMIKAPISKFIQTLAENMKKL